jgi:hypothetical protein
VPVATRITVAVAALLALALAPDAGAVVPPPTPKLRTDLACYVANRYRVSFAGSGFTANASYRLELNGHRLRTGRVSATGHISGPTFTAPSVGTHAERAFTLTAIAGRQRASARFRTTRVSANFTVPAGSSTGLRTRFRIRGFGPFGSGPKRTVYLHYIRPNGSLRRTVRLGRTQGACGHLTTAPRPVFPFTAQPGTWHFQFDTRFIFRRHPRAPFARLTVTVIRSR